MAAEVLHFLSPEERLVLCEKCAGLISIYKHRVVPDRLAKILQVVAGRLTLRRG